MTKIKGSKVLITRGGSGIGRIMVLMAFFVIFITLFNFFIIL